MIRKTVLRLVRLAAALAGVLVASFCLAGYLALSEPSFYTALRTHQPAPDEVAAATAQIEQERTAYVHWRSRVLADRRAGLEGEAVAPHEVRFGSAQLNALIASEAQSLAGGLEDPRVRVTPGRVDIACGVQTPVACCVVSACYKPTLTAEGVLELEVESASLGRLPIPLQTLLGFLPQKKERLSGSLYLDLTGAEPRFTLDLSDKANSLMAESIECGAGEMIVRFVARPPAD